MRSGIYIPQPTDYKSFTPTSLPPEPPISLSEENQTKLQEADRLLAGLNTLGESLPNPSLFVAMYVRREALLSSQIEGTQATMDDLLTFETFHQVDNIDDVEEVINYIQALNYGVDRLNGFPLSTRVILELHKLLMESTRGAHQTPGEFRHTQNWIGPPGAGLTHARFIPPPPGQALEAISDLEKFLHAPSDLHPLVACSLIHYQFETIHPFLDGNGRVGRLLIPLYLHWKKILLKPLLTISLFFKIHRQEYFDRLNLVRDKGDYEQWISFFLEAIVWTAKSCTNTIATILALKESLTQQAATIPSRHALNLLDHLFKRPMVTAAHTADTLAISTQTASTLLKAFTELDILEEVTGKQRRRRYAFAPYLELLTRDTTSR